MNYENYLILEFPSKSVNEGLARSAVACFVSQLDPTMEELGDIKTAVSEAVTNCIVHAYPGDIGIISLKCRILQGSIIDIVIRDRGVGIATLSAASTNTLPNIGKVLRLPIVLFTRWRALRSFSLLTVNFIFLPLSIN